MFEEIVEQPTVQCRQSLHGDCCRKANRRTGRLAAGLLRASAGRYGSRPSTGRAGGWGGSPTHSLHTSAVAMHWICVQPNRLTVSTVYTNLFLKCPDGVPDDLLYNFAVMMNFILRLRPGVLRFRSASVCIEDDCTARSKGGSLWCSMKSSNNRPSSDF